MSKAWMPLYIADYLADTAHLSAMQSGAYLHLIMHYWQQGKLPDDDAKLAMIAKMRIEDWRRHRGTVQAFFHDGWHHKRIDTELARAEEISNKRRASAEQMLSKRRANAEQVHQQMLPQSQSQLQSKKERKKDSPAEDAGIEDAGYVFESGVIRLTKRDYDRWKKAFVNINLEAELVRVADWAGKQRNWFNAVAGLLGKRDQENLIRIKKFETQPEDGVIWRPAMIG